MPDTVEQHLARQDSKLDGIAEDVTEIRHTLQGNGSPGLIRDVYLLKQQMAQSNSAQSLWRTALVTGFVSSVVSIIMGALAAAVWMAVK